MIAQWCLPQLGIGTASVVVRLGVFRVEADGLGDVDLLRAFSPDIVVPRVFVNGLALADYLR